MKNFVARAGPFHVSPPLRPCPRERHPHPHIADKVAVVKEQLQKLFASLKACIDKASDLFRRLKNQVRDLIKKLPHKSRRRYIKRLGRI